MINENQIFESHLGERQQTEQCTCHKTHTWNFYLATRGTQKQTQLVDFTCRGRGCDKFCLRHAFSQKRLLLQRPSNWTALEMKNKSSL